VDSSLPWLADRRPQTVAVRRVQGVAAFMTVDLDDGDIPVTVLADLDILPRLKAGDSSYYADWSSR
jgi:hypothetical protein